MRRDIVTALIAMVVFTILLGVVYPFAIEGVSQVFFPGAANGSKVYFRGRLVGSKLIGQSFSGRAAYFQSRPSGTKPAYNAAESTFTNSGPNSVKTEEAIARNIRSYLAMERPYDPALTVGQVPVDAVNASASGLDPEISPANARIQAHRVAAVRRLPLATVESLVARYTSERGLGFSGEPGVNVLELNLALDRLAGGGA